MNNNKSTPHTWKAIFFICPTNLEATDKNDIQIKLYLSNHPHFQESSFVVIPVFPLLLFYPKIQHCKLQACNHQNSPSKFSNFPTT